MTSQTGGDKVSVQNQTLTVEDKVKNIFKKVLDIQPGEIEADVSLAESLEIDSTEMVEIAVALKKEFNIPIADNELKKTHSFNQITQILKSKGVK